MFFIMGIQDEQKELSLDQTVLCPLCGKFGHLRIVMVCTCFSLFFIPLFRWNRRYYATMGCCGASCQLDPELGRRIAKGEVTSLDPSSLPFQRGYGKRRCRRCGYETSEEFAYCPQCGTRF